MKDLVVDKTLAKDELSENLEKRRKVFTQYLIGTIESAFANEKQKRKLKSLAPL
jgi:hypothetical protein